MGYLYIFFFLSKSEEGTEVYVHRLFEEHMGRYKVEAYNI